MKKFLLYVILPIVLVIVGYLIWKSQQVIRVNVAVDVANKKDITEVVSASGKIYPEVEVKISSDVSGEITNLDVQEGDTVKKGQVVARIYPDIYNSEHLKAEAFVTQQQAVVDNSQASIASYKAQLDQTEAAYKREKQLLDEKVVSRSEYETSESQYLTAKANYNAALQNVRSGQAAVASAQASLTEADKDLSRTIILAPMNGIISLLSVKRGERVVGTAQMAGTEMMRVADMSVMEVQVDVGENDIPKVRIGDSALVEVDAYNNRKFKGIVTQIANGNANAAQTTTTSTTSNTDVTNYKVHVRLLPDSYKDLMVPGRPFPFRPGMSASADIQTRRKSGVLAIPILSVTTAPAESDSAKTKAAEQKELAASRGEDPAAGTDNQREVVYLVHADTVRQITVTTGIQDNDFIEITGGIQPGDTVVSAPFNAISKELKNGTKIKITPKDKLFETK